VDSVDVSMICSQVCIQQRHGPAMHGISTAGSMFMDSESRQIAESDELQSQMDRMSTMSKLVEILNDFQTSGTSGEERKKQAATRGARTLRLQPVPANTEVFDMKILTS
jgi:hypothetical protein